MRLTTVRPTCATCRHANFDQDGSGIGFCHLNPPTLYGEGRSSAFPPVTLARTFCSQHRRPSLIARLLTWLASR